eukprot:INCI5004.19.p1 GENE.INCI5004.19~~INCI5004.19.p1  ORF type:complete len:666 (+),score=53.93 INCI5004.19:254-2251(+)
MTGWVIGALLLQLTAVARAEAPAVVPTGAESWVLSVETTSGVETPIWIPGITGEKEWEVREPTKMQARREPEAVTIIREKYRHMVSVLALFPYDRRHSVLEVNRGLTTIESAGAITGVPVDEGAEDQMRTKRRIRRKALLLTRKARLVTDAFESGRELNTRGGGWIGVVDYYRAYCVLAMAKRATEVASDGTNFDKMPEIRAEGASLMAEVFHFAYQLRDGDGFRSPCGGQYATTQLKQFISQHRAAREAAERAAHASAAAEAEATAEAEAAAAEEEARRRAETEAAAAEAAAAEAANDAAKARSRARPVMPVVADAEGAWGRHGLEAIDHIPVEDFLFSGVRLIERVPASCITKWARVQVDVAEAVMEAYASGDSNKMNTAYKWWLSMQIIFLRHHGKSRGRGRRSVDTPAARFEAWENRQYGKLVAWTERAIRHNRPRQHKATDEHERLTRALSLLSVGELGKAKRMLLSQGTADLSDQRVASQLSRKIYQERLENLPGELHDGGDPFERVQVKLKNRYKKLSKKAGCEPDGTRNEFLIVLADEHADNKAARAVEPHKSIAELFLNAEMPQWVHYAYAAVQAVALIKEEKGEGKLWKSVPSRWVPVCQECVKRKPWRMSTCSDTRVLTPIQVAVGVPSGLEKLSTALVHHFGSATSNTCDTSI